MTAATILPLGATPATPAETSILVRDAAPSDNAALVRLATACPMRGDLTMCMDREPDFFALARLEGERWRVGVVASNGTVGAAVMRPPRGTRRPAAARRCGPRG